MEQPTNDNASTPLTAQTDSITIVLEQYRLHSPDTYQDDNETNNSEFTDSEEIRRS